MNTNNRISLSFDLLRYAYGAVILLAGLDKLLGTDLIVVWSKYISPFVADMLPVSPGVFLIFMGVVEVAVAIMLLTKYQRIGAYLTAVWLLLISIDLVMLGFLDIAVRDVLLAVGAIVLVQLTAVVGESKIAYKTA